MGGYGVLGLNAAGSTELPLECAGFSSVGLRLFEIAAGAVQNSPP